ncbi:hypothetical protein C8Q80DRAFT_1275659 [Daedaleopsis nitida]|nr:hypothetical protein C8Q80DRAFT_1275659 [Daedaleopsis nitida]
MHIFPFANTIAENVAVYESLLVNDYIGITTGVVLVYDYLLTFDREFELFWRRKITWATALFFFNRYVPLLQKIFDIGGGVPVSLELTFQPVKPPTADGCFIPWAVFSSLRVAALSGSRVVSVLVFILSMVPFATNLSRYGLGMTGVIVPHFGCITYIVLSNAQVIAQPAELGTSTVTAVARACQLVSDCILIYVTWTTPSIQAYRRDDSLERTISGAVWRNGSLLFVMLFVTNALQIVLTTLFILPAYQCASYVSAFNASLTAAIISRFFFDLQDANRKALDMDSMDESTISRMGRRVLR